jgi:hypothetical protein
LQQGNDPKIEYARTWASDRERVGRNRLQTWDPRAIWSVQDHIPLDAAEERSLEVKPVTVGARSLESHPVPASQGA